MSAQTPPDDLLRTIVDIARAGIGKSHPDERRPKRLHGLKAPIRSQEEAIAEQAIERAKWERRS